MPSALPYFHISGLKTNATLLFYCLISYWTILIEVRVCVWQSVWPAPQAISSFFVFCFCGCEHFACREGKDLINTLWQIKNMLALGICAPKLFFFPPLDFYLICACDFWLFSLYRRFILHFYGCQNNPNFLRESDLTHSKLEQYWHYQGWRHFWSISSCSHRSKEALLKLAEFIGHPVSKKTHYLLLGRTSFQCHMGSEFLTDIHPGQYWLQRKQRKRTAAWWWNSMALRRFHVEKPNRTTTNQNIKFCKAPY